MNETYYYTGSSYLDRGSIIDMDLIHKGRPLKKTYVDYTRLSAVYKANLVKWFLQWIEHSVKRKGSQYRDYISPCGHFRFFGNDFYIAETFSRKPFDNDKKVISWASAACYSFGQFTLNHSGYYGDEVKMSRVKVVKSVLRDVFVSLGICEPMTKQEMNIKGVLERSFHYRIKEYSDNDLRHQLHRVAHRELPEYSLPLDAHSYRVVEVDGDYKIAFDRRGRVTHMKVGKGIRKMFRDIDYTPTDEEVKRIVNAVAVDYSDFEFRIVKGKDIDKYYLEDNYLLDYGSLGSLGSSCMRHSECVDRDFFEIYKDNCEMLIFVHKDQDKIIGRALLWKPEDLDEGNTGLMMDRVYSDEKVYNKFFSWAANNGYYRKRYQSYDNECEFVPPTGSLDDTEEKRWSMDIDLTNYFNLPYMDTLAWGDENCIRNIEDFGCYSARDTDGNLSGRLDDDY